MHYLKFLNGFTAEERLDGMNVEIAYWHAGNKFLKVCLITSIICCFFYIHYTGSLIYSSNTPSIFNCFVQSFMPYKLVEGKAVILKRSSCTL